MSLRLFLKDESRPAGTGSIHEANRASVSRQCASHEVPATYAPSAPSFPDDPESPPTSLAGSGVATVVGRVWRPSGVPSPDAVPPLSFLRLRRLAPVRISPTLFQSGALLGFVPLRSLAPPGGPAAPHPNVRIAPSVRVRRRPSPCMVRLDCSARSVPGGATDPAEITGCPAVPADVGGGRNPFGLRSLPGISRLLASRGTTSLRKRSTPLPSRMPVPPAPSRGRRRPAGFEQPPCLQGFESARAWGWC